MRRNAVFSPLGYLIIDLHFILVITSYECKMHAKIIDKITLSVNQL